MGHNKFEDVTAEVGLRPHGWCRRRELHRSESRRLARHIFPEHAGPHPLLRKPGGKKFVEKTEEYFPERPGVRWGSSSLTMTTTGRWICSSRTCTPTYEPKSLARRSRRPKIRNPGTRTISGATRTNFIFGNAFYHNLGNGKFEEISDQLGVGDLLADGDRALGTLTPTDGTTSSFTAGMSFPYRYGINSLLLNNRGEKVPRR